MTTEAGKRLLAYLVVAPLVRDEDRERLVAIDIAAIEAEARAQGALHESLASEGDIERARAALLAELEAGVEGLPIDYYGSDMSWDKAGVLRVNTIPARQMIDRAAVLDLIRKAGGT